MCIPKLRLRCEAFVPTGADSDDDDDDAAGADGGTGEGDAEEEEEDEDEEFEERCTGRDSGTAELLNVLIVSSSDTFSNTGVSLV